MKLLLEASDMEYARFHQRLSGRQFDTLSDIFADMGQVFLASIILPAFGFGGTVNLTSIVAGMPLMMFCFIVALYFPRSYHGSYDSCEF